MSTEQNVMKKTHAAKRFVYERPGKCSVGGQVFEIQIINISSSGIQFGSSAEIPLDQVVKVSWKDPKFGGFDVTFLIRRRAENDSIGGIHPFYYGAQYYDVPSDKKNQLLELLRHFSNEEKSEVQNYSQKVTPDYVFSVIDQGSLFLKNILSMNSIPPHFEKLINQIKDYEKESFKTEDPFSKCIQQLTTLNFHCLLLEFLVPLTIEKNEYEMVFLNRVIDRIQSISESDSYTEQTLGRITKENRESAHPHSDINKKINESTNRLFYSKQTLLRHILQAFGNTRSGTASDNFRESIDQIKKEYDKTISLLSFTDEVYPQTFNRPTVRPVRKFREYPKTNPVIVDIQAPTAGEKTNPFIMTAGILFIFVVSAMYLTSAWEERSEGAALKKKLEKQMKLSFFHYQSGQIIAGIPSNRWLESTPEQQKATYISLIQFLKNEKKVQALTLFDDHEQKIKTLHARMTLPKPKSAQRPLSLPTRNGLPPFQKFPIPTSRPPNLPKKN